MNPSTRESPLSTACTRVSSLSIRVSILSMRVLVSRWSLSIRPANAIPTPSMAITDPSIVMSTMSPRFDSSLKIVQIVIGQSKVACVRWIDYKSGQPPKAWDIVIIVQIGVLGYLASANFRRPARIGGTSYILIYS